MYIQTLDGIYNKPDPDTELAKKQRAKAYRGQSTFLLRHVDFLIAAVNGNELKNGKAGGTLETINNAVNFGLSVIYIDVTTGDTRLLNRTNDLYDINEITPLKGKNIPEKLNNLIYEIIDGGLIANDKNTSPQNNNINQKFLKEFYERLPPSQNNFRDKIQTTFFNYFKPKKVKEKKSKDSIKKNKQAGFNNWKIRSTKLNYYYSGLYRGAFLLNYGLAVVAVFLALVSIVLLSHYHIPSQAQELTYQSQQAHNTNTPAEKNTLNDHQKNTNKNNDTPIVIKNHIKQHHHEYHWVFYLLLALGILKLFVVWFIFKNTKKNHKGQWNERAVDYRYLAERLRTLMYLPAIGSFQPPEAPISQNESLALRQGTSEWLFKAILRSVSPAQFLENPESNILEINPQEALTFIKEHWLKAQSNHHKNKAKTMKKMTDFFRGYVEKFSIGVIVIVCFDLGILLLEICRYIPHSWATIVYSTSLILLFSATLIPAVK